MGGVAPERCGVAPCLFDAPELQHVTMSAFLISFEHIFFCVMWMWMFFFIDLSHAANRQAVARQGEAAGLRAVDLSSDQRPMREDERSRIVQQATCAVIGVGLMEDWIDILSCVYYMCILYQYIMYQGRQTPQKKNGCSSSG